jgi:hypothetical protein
MKGKLLFNLRRTHDTAGFLRITQAMTAMTALALAAPAFAQASHDAPDAVSASAPAADVVSASATFAPAAGATDVSTSDTYAPAAGAAIVAPDSGYALPPPDDGAPADPTLPIPIGASGIGDSATAASPAADGTSADAPLIDPATPMPLAKVAPIVAAEWDRVGDSESNNNSDSGDSGDKVLEVPRALPPDASPASGNGQSAQGGDSLPPDEVGSVDDYQDEQDDGVIGVYIAPPNGPPVLNPPFSVGTFGNQSPARVPAQPNNGPILPPGVGGIRPFAGGMNSAIMPTSPMFPRGMPMGQGVSPMAPRNSAPIPGGWWNRAR